MHSEHALTAGPLRISAVFHGISQDAAIVQPTVSCKLVDLHCDVHAFVLAAAAAATTAAAAAEAAPHDDVTVYGSSNCSVSDTQPPVVPTSD